MSQLSAMRELGVTAIRVDANWDRVQPSGPAGYTWGKLDQEVASIRASHLSADLIIDGCPPWAATVAARYAPFGVNDFEIWNEPNIARFWQPKPDPAAYTADLIAAYHDIKRYVPTALVISGGLSPATTDSADYSPTDFLADMYADGAQGNFDVLGMHPYTFPAAPDTFRQGSAWSQMSRTAPSIRSIMTAHGDAAKQVWITEFGAPTVGPQAVSQADQAQELSQAMQYAKENNWIGAFYIYTRRDIAALPVLDNGFGLLDDAGAQKQAYATVRAALAQPSSAAH